MVTRQYGTGEKPGRCPVCKRTYTIFRESDKGCPFAECQGIHGDVIHNAHPALRPRPSARPVTPKDYKIARDYWLARTHVEFQLNNEAAALTKKLSKKVDKPSTLCDNTSIGVTDMLDIAISITAQAFEGKTDKGGVPYVMHCLHVMSEVRKKFREDTELQCIAMLHDIVEDTDWTLDLLREKGFSARVVRGVEVLTHENDISYDDYIKRIGMYEDARQVKMADLRHNSDIMRIKGLTKKDFERMEKYQRSYHYLSK